MVTWEFQCVRLCLCPMMHGQVMLFKPGASATFRSHRLGCCKLVPCNVPPVDMLLSVYDTVKPRCEPSFMLWPIRHKELPACGGKV